MLTLPYPTRPYLSICKKANKYSNLHYFLWIFLLCCNLLHGDEQIQAPAIDLYFFQANELVPHRDSNVQVIIQKYDSGHSKTLLVLKNFPTNGKISASIKRSLKKEATYEKKSEFFISQLETVASRNNPMEEYPFFCVTARGFLPGERIVCRFTAQDSDFKIETSLIPNPIRVTDKSGTVFAEAELVQAIPAFYQFHFSEFQNDEQIDILSISGPEEIKTSLKISKDGMYLSSPDILNKNEGIGKLIFIRKSGEKIEINLPWGKELHGYLVGDRIYKPN